MQPDNARIRDAFGFFNKNRDIYEASEYWFEEIQFPEQAIKQEIYELREEYAHCSEDTPDDHDRRTRARDRLFESLSYWTVYFEPQFEDVSAALEAGLVPFYYRDTFYLALGACGMDLSPKLDAYQAVVSGTIPRDSQLFKQESYFEHVVGEDLTARVKEQIGHTPSAARTEVVA
jgi:hypothetical protein